MVAEILESADVVSSIHCIIWWLISNQSLKLVLQYNILNAKLKLKYHNNSQYMKKNYWGNYQSSANPIPFTKARSNALNVNIIVIKDIVDVYIMDAYCYINTWACRWSLCLGQRRALNPSDLDSRPSLFQSYSGPTVNSKINGDRNKNTAPSVTVKRDQCHCS